MLVSYDWLKDYLDLTISPEELANKVTLTGIEIAGIEHKAAGLKKLVAGKVMELANHPDSDHLKVAKVDVGDEILQIVCGAPNIAIDQTVIVALSGARIAGNEKIKRGKMRGVVSEGMICSLQEIGFDDSVVPKRYADGIYVFEEEIEPGTEIYEALGMNDYVLDFDITPNRADTLSMHGAAYEVGAIVSETPSFKSVQVEEVAQKFEDDFEIDVDQNLVSKYLLRKIHGIKIKNSPMWMQRRLWNAGIRPINNIVDITNYVMLTTGQPLHAFDANAISSKKIVVRLANKNESMVLLNEQQISLDENDLVITDGTTPIALAGVMGGLDSEITDETVDVIIESAIFDGAHIRKTAQRHNLRSEASNRFEKGLDYDSTLYALNLAASLMAEYADGDVYQGIVSGSDVARPELTIKITTEKINHILGTTITREEVLAIFARLGFKTTVLSDEKQTIVVAVPNRRFDIFIAADLIEEIARVYGYANLPSTLPSGAHTRGGYSNKQVMLNRLKDVLIGQGLVETINYSLTDELKAKMFTQNRNDLVKVAWPLNSGRTAMRQNLLSGLLDSVAYNVARNQKELRLFEQGRVFDQFNGKYDEYEHLAAVYVGDTQNTNWQHNSQMTDFYYVKGQVEYIFSMLGLSDSITYRPTEISGMHPTRTAGIYFKNNFIGVIGQINPGLTKKMKSKDVYGFELNLQSILEIKMPVVQSTPVPKFPAIKRDLSLLVDKKLDNSEIEEVIKANGGKYLQNTLVFDVFSGALIEPTKKAIAYQLVFMAEDRTLTDTEIESAMQKIITSLSEKFQIVVR